MRFVHHDETESRERREDGGPCAHHYPRLAGTDAGVLGRPPALRKAAVKHAHHTSETCPEATHGLHGEGDLGHQHQNPPALRHHLGDELQVHLGLAAPGDAPQEGPLGIGGMQVQPEALDRRHLFGGEREGGGIVK